MVLHSGPQKQKWTITLQLMRERDRKRETERGERERELLVSSVIHNRRKEHSYFIQRERGGGKKDRERLDMSTLFSQHTRAPPNKTSWQTKLDRYGESVYRSQVITNYATETTLRP